jgi:WD40 repeat protein
MELVQPQNAMPDGTSIDAVKMSQTLSSSAIRITEKKRGTYTKATGFKREHRDLLAHLMDNANLGSSTSDAAEIDKESKDGGESKEATDKEGGEASNDVEDSKRDLARNQVICMKAFYPQKDKRGNSTGEPVLIIGTRDGHIVVSQLEPPFDHVNTYKMHDKAITALQVYQPPGEALITILSASLDKNIKVSIMLSGKLVTTLRHHETQRQIHYRKEKKETYQIVKKLQERKAWIKARVVSPQEIAKLYALPIDVIDASPVSDTSDAFDIDDKKISITQFEKNMGMEVEAIELSIFEEEDDMDDEILYRNELKALELEWMQKISENPQDREEIEDTMKEDIARRAQEREEEQEKLDVEGHSRAVFSIDLLYQHQSEPLVLSASLDGTVKLWSLLRKENPVLHTIHTSVGAIFKAKIFAHPYVLQGFANGSLSHHEASANIFVLVAGEDRTARLFSIQDGLEKQIYGDPTQLQTFGHQARITDITSVWDNHLYENTTATAASNYDGDVLARASVGMQVFTEDENYDFIAQEEKEKTCIRRYCGGLKKLCFGCCCYYDKCCHCSCCPDEKYMATISTESQKKKVRMWRRLLEAEEDDFGVTATDPMVITACIDGKIRVFHAISGVLIRQLFDETLVHSTIEQHGLGELSPIYCVQTYECKASNTHKEEVKRRAEESNGKNNKAGIDLNRLGKVFQPPLGTMLPGDDNSAQPEISKAKGILGAFKLLEMAVRCIYNILVYLVSFVYATATEAYLADEDEDFMNLMQTRELSAGEYLDGLCGIRVYAGHRNGKVLCWDIATGILITSVMTESEEPVMGLDIVTQQGDVYWPESKRESIKQWFEKYISRIGGRGHQHMTDLVSTLSRVTFEEVQKKIHHSNDADDSKSNLSENQHNGSKDFQKFSVNNPIHKGHNGGETAEDESDIMEILRWSSTVSSATGVPENSAFDEIPDGATIVEELNENGNNSIYARKKRRELVEKLLASYEPSRCYLKPNILSVSLQGRLEYTYDTNTFNELFKAYRDDLHFLLPKPSGRNGKVINIPQVPLEFRDWPRVYLLSTCERYGTLGRLFYGVNFFIFFIAVHDRSDSFVSTFLPFASSGITMESYTMTMRRKVSNLARMKRDFDPIYISKYAPVDINPGLCVLLWMYTFRTSSALYLFLDSTNIVDEENLDHLGTTFLNFCCRKNISNSSAAQNALTVWKNSIDTPPVSLLDQTAGPGLMLGTDELCSVAVNFPHEFQTFLCSLEPLQAHPLTKMNCDTSIQKEKEIKFAPSNGTLKGDQTLWQEDNVSLHEELTCFYLPLGRPMERQLLSAVNDVCKRIRSSKIFDSSFGRIVNKYAWRNVFSFIHTSHLIVTIRLIIFTALLCCFALPPTSANVVLSLDTVSATVEYTHIGWYIYVESSAYLVEVARRVKESGKGWLAFLGNAWNLLDVTIYIMSIIVSYWIIFMYRAHLVNVQNTDPYKYTPYPHELAVHLRILMAAIVLMLGVKLLGFFRAYESTGILVALVVETLVQMKTYLFVILIVTLAFAQSFWAITLASTGITDLEQDDVLSGMPDAMAFMSMKGSMVTLFRWSFGNFDPTQLEYLSGFTLNFCILLASLFMLLVTVVLFNLLIAYMSDVFVALQNRGKSEWGLILSKTMTALDYFAHMESYEMLLPQGYRERKTWLGSVLSFISDSSTDTDIRKTWHTYYPRIIHFVRRTKDVSTERDLEESEDKRNDAEAFLKLAQQKTMQLGTDLEGWRQSNTMQIGLVTRSLQSSREELTDLFVLEKSNKKKVKMSAYDL